MTGLTIGLSRPARMIVNNQPSKTSTPLCPEDFTFAVAVRDCFSARFSDWLSSFLCHPSIRGNGGAERGAAICGECGEVFGHGGSCHVGDDTRCGSRARTLRQRCQGRQLYGWTGTCLGGGPGTELEFSGGCEVVPVRPAPNQPKEAGDSAWKKGWSAG